MMTDLTVMEWRAAQFDALPPVLKRYLHVSQQETVYGFLLYGDDVVYRHFERIAEACGINPTDEQRIQSRQIGLSLARDHGRLLRVFSICAKENRTGVADARLYRLSRDLLEAADDLHAERLEDDELRRRGHGRPVEFLRRLLRNLDLAALTLVDHEFLYLWGREVQPLTRTRLHRIADKHGLKWFVEREAPDGYQDVLIDRNAMLAAVALLVDWRAGCTGPIPETAKADLKTAVRAAWFELTRKKSLAWSNNGGINGTGFEFLTKVSEACGLEAPTDHVVRPKRTRRK